MKVKVYFKGKDERPVFCCVFSEREKFKESDFDFVERVIKMHEEDLFDEPLYSTGISRITTFADKKSSFRTRDGKIEWGQRRVLLGEYGKARESKIIMGVDMFREGWCLKVTTLTGDTRYFQKINRRTVNTVESICSAHLYHTLADIKRDIGNKIRTLNYCANNFGWTLELVESCEEFKKDYDAVPHTKREKETMEEVKKMIEAINAKNTN